MQVDTWPPHWRLSRVAHAAAEESAKGQTNAQLCKREETGGWAASGIASGLGGRMLYAAVNAGF